MAEESCLILFKPFLGLYPISSKVDEVDEHDEEYNYNGDTDGDLYTKSPLSTYLGCITELNDCCISRTIEHCIHWESSHSTLPKGHVLRIAW